jgi:hypothetical protein
MIVEAFAWAMIERACDLVAAGLSEIGQRGTCGQILADEPVGVFVGAAVSSVMRGGEVEGGAEVQLDVLHSASRMLETS